MIRAPGSSAGPGGRGTLSAMDGARRTFTVGGVELAYETWGQGPRTTVLLHGLLLDAGINRGLAQHLAAKGHRVHLLELPGHGRSDKPRRASAHRMDAYARHVLQFLDHLEVEEAVLGGVSLGADVSLLAAAERPDRVRALLLEMPVLEHATPFAALLFVPLLLGLHFSGRVGGAVNALVRRLPRTGNDVVDSFLAAASSHPEEIKAVLHGILLGPTAPTEEVRRGLRVPTLVIGHGSDLLHPFSDAERLARQLPDVQLVRARSPMELRRSPERLSAEIARFLDRAWSARLVPSDHRTG